MVALCLLGSRRPSPMVGGVSLPGDHDEGATEIAKNGS